MSSFQADVKTLLTALISNSKIKMHVKIIERYTLKGIQN